MEQQISRNSFPQPDWRLRAAVGSCMYAMVRKNIYQGQDGELTKSGHSAQNPGSGILSAMGMFQPLTHCCQNIPLSGSGVV